MFGLGEDKDEKKGEGEFTFDLETEVLDSAKCQEIVANMVSKMQRIKEILRSGEKKEEFDKLGVVLHGYNSLRMVINRVKTLEEQKKG